MKEKKTKPKMNMKSFLVTPFVLVIPPIVGYYAGSWLDGFFHTGTLLTTILLSLGFIAGFRETYLLIKKITRDD